MAEHNWNAESITDYRQSLEEILRNFDVVIFDSSIFNSSNNRKIFEKHFNEITNEDYAIVYRQTQVNNLFFLTAEKNKLYTLDEFYNQISSWMDGIARNIIQLKKESTDAIPTRKQETKQKIEFLDNYIQSIKRITEKKEQLVIQFDTELFQKFFSIPSTIEAALKIKKDDKFNRRYAETTTAAALYLAAKNKSCALLTDNEDTLDLFLNTYFQLVTDDITGSEQGQTEWYKRLLGTNIGLYISWLRRETVKDGSNKIMLMPNGKRLELVAQTKEIGKWGSLGYTTYSETTRSPIQTKMDLLNIMKKISGSLKDSSLTQKKPTALSQENQRSTDDYYLMLDGIIKSDEGVLEQIKNKLLGKKTLTETELAALNEKSNMYAAWKRQMQRTFGGNPQLLEEPFSRIEPEINKINSYRKTHEYNALSEKINRMNTQLQKIMPGYVSDAKVREHTKRVQEELDCLIAQRDSLDNLLCNEITEIKADTKQSDYKIKNTALLEKFKEAGYVKGDYLIVAASQYGKVKGVMPSAFKLRLQRRTTDGSIPEGAIIKRAAEHGRQISYLIPLEWFDALTLDRRKK